MSGRQRQGTIYGHEVVSNVALGWLDHQPPDDLPISVVVTDTTEHNSVDGGNAATRGSNDAGVSVRPLADGRIVAELRELGSYVLDPVRLQVLAPTPPVERHEVWEHTLYSWAIPMLLTSGGRFLLHAAAIETSAGALLVVGPTTRGKTSFASEAVRCGFRLLGEDGIAVRLDQHSGRAVAYPGCRGIRLRHDDEGRPTPKVTRDVPDSLRCCEPRPIAAIVALAPRTAEGTTPKILGAASAISALRVNSFAIPSALRGLYPTIAKIAGIVPVATTSLRDGLTYLPSEIERLVTWSLRLPAAAA